MIPRPTVDELIARYDLEPELKDIYVEGSFDRDLLKKYCAESNLNDRVIYEINVVDIPFDLIAKYNFTEGNKQRVITLAKELSVIPKECNYTCIVDKDLDHWFGKEENVPRLFWTNYCAIELYFFNENFIKNLFELTLGCIITKWDDFFASFVGVLKQLYCIRLSDYALGLKMEWIAIDKSLSGRYGVIEFNVDDYFLKVLNKNSCSKQKDNVTQCYRDWLLKLEGDPRLWIRGHDFVDLIVWVSKNFKGYKEVSNEVAIQRILIGETKNIDDNIERLVC